MEKLLTTETEEFNGFLVDSPNPARSEAGDKQAYHYTMVSSVSPSLASSFVILTFLLPADRPPRPTIST